MKNFHKAFTVKIFAAILSVCIACPFAYAADVGKVTYVEGRVDVLRQNSDTATPLKEGDSISVGDAVRTKSNAKAEVAFNDKSILRVAQNSKVVVKDYQLDEKNRRNTANLLVERGKARMIIAKMPRAAEFIISTPNASGTVKGSDIFTSYQAGSSGMLVSEGKLSVVNTLRPEPAILIPAGSSVVVPLEESPKGPRQYFEVEKKLYEQDTNIPATIARSKDASVIKGTIAKLSGDVKVTFKATGESRAATINDILEAGDLIETGDNGMVEIKFDNGNGVNLKPNSDLRITMLVMDPRTGEYENLFESTKGKIRARIEGLKGKSKFEVRTPTAVSGARGTIMYLEVTPTGVRAFFEGGTGSLASLVSGIERMVAAGENASANISGSVSDSTPTPEGDRMSWGEGWTPGNGTEGYSSSDGSTGVYLSNDGGNIGIIGRASTEGLNGGMGHDPFSDPLLHIPTGDTGKTEEGEKTEEAEETISGSSGTIASNIYPYNNFTDMTDPSGYFSGIVGVVGTFWGGNDALFVSAGDIVPGTQGSFIWNGILHSYISGSGETYYNTTTDGGAFYGVVSGIGGFTVENTKVLVGFASLLYIDPSGNAGIAQGDIVGPFSEETETYVLVSSKLTGTEKVSGIGIDPSNLIDFTVADDRLNGEIYGYYEDMSGSSTFGATYYISGQKWGVYNLSFGSRYNAYYDDGSKTWIADMDGSGFFGDRNAPSYGVMSGKCYGVYDGEGNWLGTSIGSWEAREEDEGSIGGDYAAQYVGFAGGLRTDGILMGNMVAIYDQSMATGYNFNENWFSFSSDGAIFYGGFNGGDNMYVDTFDGKFYNIAGKDWGIWGARMTGGAEESGSIFKLFMAGDVTNDGTSGYWFGLVAGLKSPGLETITGMFSGISLGFTDGDTKAGLVSGNVIGNMNLDTYDWEAVGMGTWRWVGTTELDPGSVYDFYDSIYESGFNMGGAGAFGNGESMSMDSFSGSVFNLAGENDGIWVATFGGPCGTPSNKFDVGLYGIAGSETYRYILGEIKGPSDDTYLSGAYNGIWIGLSDNVPGQLVGGKMTGETVGYIDIDEGTWNAVAAGEWVEADSLLVSDATTMSDLNAFVQGLSNNAVNIPITEACPAIAGSFNGVGSISGTMNTAFYSNAAVAPGNGIWAALFNGIYDGMPIGGVDSWAANVTGDIPGVGPISATITGIQWSNNQILGNLQSNEGSAINLTGQMTGTYTTPTEQGSGTFTGVGAGVWNAPGTTPVTPPQQPVT